MKVEMNSSTSGVFEKLITNITMMVDARSRISAYTEYDKKISDTEENIILETYKSIGVDKNTIKHDINELLENPYYKNIKLEDVKYKNISYSNLVIKARRGLEMSYAKFHGTHLESYVDMGYFDRSVNIPILKENGDIWMSPTIAEQRSMQEDIDKATGKVLTFGLGIGYYSYMCLIKENVESVTIVEFNPDVIALFKKYILPQFPQDKKIEIIEGNMYDYYNVAFLSKFDYIFVDVWKDNDDGLEHYRKLMATGIRMDNIGYWIEDSVIEPIKMLMTVYFRSLASGTLMKAMQGIGDNNFHDLKRVHKYFKGIDKTVTDGNELLGYINSIDVIRDITAL